MCCLLALLSSRYSIFSLYAVFLLCFLPVMLSSHDMLSSRYSIVILCCFLSLFSSRFVFYPVYAVVFPLCLLLALLSSRYGVFPLFFSLCCLFAVLLVILSSRSSRYAIFSHLSFSCLFVLPSSRYAVILLCYLLVMLSSPSIFRYHAVIFPDEIRITAFEVSFIWRKNVLKV